MGSTNRGGGGLAEGDVTSTEILNETILSEDIDDGTITMADLAAMTDVTTHNATTSAHGFAPKATAPAAGLLSALAIGNGETAYTNKALFDTTNPAALGVAAPGTALVAARRDHVHEAPAASVDITGMTAGTTADALLDVMPIYDASATANRKLIPARWWAKCAPLIDMRPFSTTAPYGWTFTGTDFIAATATAFGAVEVAAGGADTVYFTNTSAFLFGGAKIRGRFVVECTAGGVGKPIYAGFRDNTTGAADAVDGVYFRRQSDVNGGRWEAVTSSNSVRTAADTGIAYADSTIYSLEAEVNAAGNSATFYIDGALVATIATNIPTGSGRETGIQITGDNPPLRIYRVAVWADEAMVG